MEAARTAGARALAIIIAGNSTSDDARLESANLYYVMENVPLSLGFILLCAILMMFMQLGWAQMEAGSSSSKQTQTIFMTHIVDTAVAALCFYLIGFSVAFGGEVGDDNAAGTFWGSPSLGVDKHKNRYYVVYLQFMYLSSAVTSWHGAVAGRMTFTAYITCSAVLAAFVYPTSAHWVWSADGWLRILGVVDDGGASVVNVLAGAAGLAGTLILGPRVGFRAVRPAHDKPMATKGAYLLWVGYMAFLCVTAAQTKPALQHAVLGRVASAALISSSSSIVVTVALRRAMRDSYELLDIVKAIIAGLVSIASCCAGVELWAAGIIGGIGSIVLLACVRLLRRLNVDDPLDSISIHLGCGTWSVLATGLFGNPEFLAETGAALMNPSEGIFAHNAEQLRVQVTAASSVAVWAFATMGVVMLMLKRTGHLRLSRDEETGGSDLFSHESAAYFETEQVPADVGAADGRKFDTRGTAAGQPAMAGDPGSLGSHGPGGTALDKRLGGQRRGLKGATLGAAEVEMTSRGLRKPALAPAMSLRTLPRLSVTPTAGKVGVAGRARARSSGSEEELGPEHCSVSVGEADSVHGRERANSEEDTARMSVGPSASMAAERRAHGSACVCVGCMQAQTHAVIALLLQAPHMRRSPKQGGERYGAPRMRPAPSPEPPFVALPVPAGGSEGGTGEDEGEGEKAGPRSEPLPSPGSRKARTPPRPPAADVEMPAGVRADMESGITGLSL